MNVGDRYITVILPLATAIMMPQEYRLRYFFEWGGPILWSSNDKARDCFGYDVNLNDLPLSPETIYRANEMVPWHDTSLDWDDPGGSSLWSEAQRDLFHLPSGSSAIAANHSSRIG